MNDINLRRGNRRNRIITLYVIMLVLSACGAGDLDDADDDKEKIAQKAVWNTSNWNEANWQ